MHMLRSLFLDLREAMISVIIHLNSPQGERIIKVCSALQQPECFTSLFQLTFSSLTDTCLSCCYYRRGLTTDTCLGHGLTAVHRSSSQR